MGVDHPGDMDYLLGIVQPDIAVLTRIAESHLANFESLAHIAKEKGKLIAALPEDGAEEDLMADVQGWFGKWMNNGLLAKAA